MVRVQDVAKHVDCMSSKVIRKVAEVEGVDPAELSPQLYEIIDPDALDQIFATTSTTGRMNGNVTFSYNGCEVTVGADNEVEVVSS